LRLRDTIRCMQVVILAAGLGRRLHPLTDKHSKAMLPISGRPMVEHLIQQLAVAQPEEYILVARPDDAELHQYFAARPEVQLVFQEEPLGSGHALLQAAHLLNGPFILSACDNLTNENHIKQMVKRWQSDPGLSGLLTVMEVSSEVVSRTAIVLLEGRRVRMIIEKPQVDQAPSNVASLPLYIFSPIFLEYLRQSRPSIRGEIELQDAIQRLIDEGNLVESLTVQLRLTLTSPDDIKAIEDYYSASGKEVRE
jgi:dTDP-glucose pyrophosphorylase